MTDKASDGGELALAIGRCFQCLARNGECEDCMHARQALHRITERREAHAKLLEEAAITTKSVAAEHVLLHPLGQKSEGYQMLVEVSGNLRALARRLRGGEG